jgi:hypothetical protein
LLWPESRGFTSAERGDIYKAFFWETSHVPALPYASHDMIEKVALEFDRLNRVQIDTIHQLAAMPNPNNIDELREALNHIYEITKP